MRRCFPAAEIFLMYGLTEAFRSTYLDPALLDEHPDSIGTAIPFAEVMVARPDGSVADPDEAGELVHTGPLVAKGYWNDPARTAERFKPARPLSYGGTAVWSGDQVRRTSRVSSISSPRRCDDQDQRQPRSPTESRKRRSPRRRRGSGGARLSRRALARRSPSSSAAGAATRRAAHLSSAELPNFMQPSASSGARAAALPHGKLDANG
jgi:acyl-CoA synthetase (AMP-forming)/AMP-acid ligase II